MQSFDKVVGYLLSIRDRVARRYWNHVGCKEALAVRGSVESGVALACRGACV